MIFFTSLADFADITDFFYSSSAGLLASRAADFAEVLVGRIFPRFQRNLREA